MYNHRVNIKARIERHSKTIKDNLSFKGEIYSILKNNFFWYKFIWLLIIFLVPIYPAFSFFLHNNTEYDFYRWFINENSIIWSYYSDDDESFDLIEKYEIDDNDFKVISILEDERDISWKNEIIEYIVQYWDSFSLLADKYRVSKQSILDTNKFTSNHILNPWDRILIPPISWIIHIVKKWENISSISKLYSIPVEKIISQNLLSVSHIISEGDKIVIPWWVRQYDKIKVVQKPKDIKKSSKSNISNKSQSKWSKFVLNQWAYQLKLKSSSNRFYWWNCTWYVAKYKNVTWSWNANEWLSNAANNWKSTWNNPSVWAIIVFNWTWYNPKYWHVGIVMDIKWNDLIVSDMNYRRLNEVTYRKVSANDRTIKWYIYVD